MSFVERWEKPEFQILRKVVLMFGGSLKREAPICCFQSVKHVQEVQLKGVLYVTTNRIVFVPSNVLPNDKLVHATFDHLSSLAGNRNNLSLFIADDSASGVYFSFQSETQLFQAFNVLKNVCEDPSKVDSCCELDETPFTTIELELSEVKPVIHSEDQEENTQLGFIKTINGTSFDVHIKLKILLVLSLVTSLLKFIPFIPLMFLFIILVILHGAWVILNSNGVSDEDTQDELENFHVCARVFQDWFRWRDEKKTKKLLKTSIIWFILYFVVPRRVYSLTFVAFVLCVDVCCLE